MGHGGDVDERDEVDHVSTAVELTENDRVTSCEVPFRKSVSTVGSRFNAMGTNVGVARWGSLNLRWIGLRHDMPTASVRPAWERLLPVSGGHHRSHRNRETQLRLE